MTFESYKYRKKGCLVYFLIFFVYRSFYHFLDKKREEKKTIMTFESYETMAASQK